MNSTIHSFIHTFIHVRSTFRYEAQSKGESWTLQDLRVFLFDLQEAFGSPRVVPDEAVSEVLKELQLNIDESTGVSWVDFKRSAVSSLFVMV